MKITDLKFLVIALLTVTFSFTLNSCSDDDDDAITLVGQLARKVLGVLFNASDVREVVGGKYAEGVVLVRQCVTEPDLERCLHWRARLGQSRLGSDRLSPAFSRAEPALARGS